MVAVGASMRGGKVGGMGGGDGWLNATTSRHRLVERNHHRELAVERATVQLSAAPNLALVAWPLGRAQRDLAPARLAWPVSAWAWTRPFPVPRLGGHRGHSNLPWAGRSRL